MSTPTAIAWTDLETTDTDPYAEHAAPLEVGIIITDYTPQLNEIARASMLIRPPGGQPEHDMIWARMLPIVREMHTENGLWVAATSDAAWSLPEADAALRDWVSDQVGDGVVPIAGSGAGHMDLPWVKHWFPALATKLTYWPLDTGDVRRLLQLAGRTDLLDFARDVDAKPHRALADVELHVAEGRRYLQLLGSIPTSVAPTPEEVTAEAARLGAGPLVRTCGEAHPQYDVNCGPGPQHPAE